MGSGLLFVHVSFGTSYFNAYSENGSLVMGNVFLNFFLFLYLPLKTVQVFIVCFFFMIFLFFFYHVFFIFFFF